MKRLSGVLIGAFAVLLAAGQASGLDLSEPKDLTLEKAQNVTVVNTTRSPVPVYEVYKPQTEPVTWGDTVSMGSNAYGVTIFSIPSGKILVVEHVTVELMGNGYLCGLYANLSVGNGLLVPVGVGTYFNSTGTGLSAVPRYTISKPMRVYVDNHQVAVQAFRCGDTSSSATIRTSVSGYLIDAE